MGQFGVMSRILAPKFGGFLTFASLRDESSTAPGQITIDELLGLYRFRSITTATKVYGIIGWPITQSMSPMVHNAGFEATEWDGVYVPMPVEGSYESFKATVLSLIDHKELNFTGASVTIPHKEHLYEFGEWYSQTMWDEFPTLLLAGNTIGIEEPWLSIENTDADGIMCLVHGAMRGSERELAIIGSGGVARSAAFICSRYAAFGKNTEDKHTCRIVIYARNRKSARKLKKSLIRDTGYWKNAEYELDKIIDIRNLDSLRESSADLYINCTPVGMTDGPDPDGLSIPIPDMDQLAPETVFFDTVYNPIETPMLKAARERGYRTIDGAAMFVKQAEAQFEIWTGASAPDGLFDRLVRERLGG